MWDGQALVRTYLNEAQARADLARLTAAGLTAAVATDNCGGMRPHFDLQVGVCLLVPADQLEDARALLDAGPPTGDPGWTCTGCGAPGEPGYDACWSCGAPRG